MIIDANGSIDDVAKEILNMYRRLFTSESVTEGHLIKYLI